jgi:hypothetical protein
MYLDRYNSSTTFSALAFSVFDSLKATNIWGLKFPSSCFLKSCLTFLRMLVVGTLALKVSNRFLICALVMGACCRVGDGGLSGSGVAAGVAGAGAGAGEAGAAASSRSARIPRAERLVDVFVFFGVLAILVRCT